MNDARSRESARVGETGPIHSNRDNGHRLIVMPYFSDILVGFGLFVGKIIDVDWCSRAKNGPIIGRR